MNLRVLFGSSLVFVFPIFGFTYAAAQDSQSWLRVNGEIAVIDYSKLEAKEALAVARQLGLPDQELERLISRKYGYDGDDFNEFDEKKSERQYIADVDEIRRTYLGSIVGATFILSDMQAKLSSYDFDKKEYLVTMRRHVHGISEEKEWHQGSTSLHYTNGMDVVASLPGKEGEALRTHFRLEMEESDASKLADLTKDGVKFRAECAGVQIYSSGNGASFDCFVTELTLQNSAGLPLIRITRTSATEGRVQYLLGN